MPPYTQNSEEAITAEKRAHEIRMMLLSDPAFATGLESAIEDERAGRLISLAEFKRELGVS